MDRCTANECLYIMESDTLQGGEKYELQQNENYVSLAQQEKKSLDSLGWFPSTLSSRFKTG